MLNNLLVLVCIPTIVLISSMSLYYKNYFLTSIIVCIMSLSIRFFHYEKKRPPAKEIVLVATMVVTCVLSRLVFILTPSFKPMYTFIIIFGMYFGKEIGYVCGSFSAFISNFFFGQGTWTPFQMVACGLIGYFSGVNCRLLKRSRVFQIIFGILMAFFYSLVMDVYATMSIEFNFNFQRYMIAVISSLPLIFIYCISNIIFLMILMPVIGAKLNRISIKYGFYKGEGNEE